MYLVLFLCVAFTCLRFTLTFPPIDLSVSTVYKDLAHLFVGGLFGAAIMAPKETYHEYDRRFALWLMAVGLTLVECIAFGISLLK